VRRGVDDRQTDNWQGEGDVEFDRFIDEALSPKEGRTLGTELTSHDLVTCGSSGDGGAGRGPGLEEKELGDNDNNQGRRRPRKLGSYSQRPWNHTSEVMEPYTRDPLLDCWIMLMAMPLTMTIDPD